MVRPGDKKRARESKKERAILHQALDVAKRGVKADSKQVGDIIQGDREGE